MPTNVTHQRRLADTRGSGLVVAIIFATVLTMVLASMLKWVMTEGTINRRSMLRLESNNASEAIAEFGFYQVRNWMENTSTFMPNAFTPVGAHPLTLPPSTLFTGTHVDTTASAVTGGMLYSIITSGSTSLYYIDANDPNNMNDPLKGKWVFRRDVPVYAKAVVTVLNGAPITSYVRESLSVRGAPLFAHAIFYNMDMELAPGAQMNIYGPVHVNGDVYVSSQGSTVNFYNTLTCTGNVYHAWKSFQATAQGQTNGTTGEALNMTADVTFKNRSNTQVAMDASGTWKDSTMGTSTTVKTNNSSGNYATQAAYTAALSTAAAANLATFRTWSSQTWNGNLQTSANGVQNYTPVAIGKYAEDTTPTDGTDQSINTGRLLIEPPTDASSAQYSAEVEQQKYSTQAGIYIQIVPASGNITTTTITGSGGSLATVATTGPLIPAIIVVRTGGPSGTIATSVPSSLIQYDPYREQTTTTSSGSTSTVVGGMYDQRRSLGIDLVEFDMAALKLAVAQMQLTPSNRDSSKAINSLESANWTGIVYVEVTSNPTTRLNGTTVAAAGGNKVGVRIKNGNSPVPSYGAAEGFTFATNAPAYVLGNFNDTGSSPSASVSKSGETPAAIAADSVTLLSAGYNDATSKSALRPNASADSMIAAAILTGISPTNKDGSARMSGGAHNLVRFLEGWSSNSRAVYIRGSLVSLFESRVADEPWRIDYYAAPTRNWGFSDLLQNGRYPPGTPRVISYRRTDYSDMTKADYDTALAALPH